MGPVINEAALRTYLSAVDRATKDGGRILIGGRRITTPPFDRGYFVEPTIIDGLPPSHPLFSEERFVPVVVISDVLTLDEAIELANRTEYGLTAGIYSEEEDDLRTFFEMRYSSEELEQLADLLGRIPNEPPADTNCSPD